MKDGDLPLFEQAHELLGESVSSMFSQFLKERVGKVAPEKRVAELVSQISRRRADLKKERGLPQFLDGVYGEAEAYAKRAVKSLGAGEVRKAKALYYAAGVYYQRAEHERNDARELREKMTEMLRT